MWSRNDSRWIPVRRRNETKTSNENKTTGMRGCPVKRQWPHEKPSPFCSRFVAEFFHRFLISFFVIFVSCFRFTSAFLFCLSSVSFSLGDRSVPRQKPLDLIHWVMAADCGHRFNGPVQRSACGQRGGNKKKSPIRRSIQSLQKVTLDRFSKPGNHVIRWKSRVIH